MVSRLPGLRILCVTRRSENLEILQAAIKRAGYDILTAATTDTAVAACLANHVSAVLLDAELLRVGGCSVAETFKAVKPSLPVILLEEREELARLRDLPTGVDVVIPTSLHHKIIATLTKLIDPA